MHTCTHAHTHNHTHAHIHMHTRTDAQTYTLAKTKLTCLLETELNFLCAVVVDDGQV